MGIKEVRETIKMCRFCFMCRHACPVFLATKLDSLTPRGHALVLSAIAERIRKWDKDIVARFYQCTLCGLCKEYCEYNWPEDELVRNAREEIVAAGKEPEKVRFLASLVINKGSLYENNEKWPFPSEVIGKKAPDVLYFAGCSTRKNHPEILKAVGRVLDHMGENWSVLEEETCCGMALFDLGYTEDAKRMAKKLADKIAQLHPKTILTGCAHCYRAFKEKFAEWQIKLPQGIKIFHLTEYLYENVLSKKLQIKIDKKIQSVSYHDPCQLGRKLGIYDPPRKLIEMVTGKPPIELFHNRAKAECCGAGTVMFLTDPEISEEVARLRVNAAIEEGAKVIITACQNCKSIFTRVNQGYIEVLDIVELISSQL